MEILTQWVTQIIIFLLLASVIDLLIPATTMKKYIRLVVGLILILIFLKPLFFMFNYDVQEALERSFSQLSNEKMETEQVENSMKIQKKDIQASQNAYILKEMAVQFKKLAETPLQEDYQAEIADIKPLFTTEADLSYENLDKVVVYLREAEMGEGAVDAVDNVVIDTNKPVISENEVDVKGIKLLLQDVWEIDNKKLTILWEGGAP